MKKIILCLVFVLATGSMMNANDVKPLRISCFDFAVQAVVTLEESNDVYLDDETAMQIMHVAEAICMWNESQR